MLGSMVIESESLVSEMKIYPASILSRTGHEKPCLNLGGPPSKAKYSLLTDSEQVPWGKDEKNPDEGSEIDFETVHLHSEKELL